MKKSDVLFTRKRRASQSQIYGWHFNPSRRLSVRLLYPLRHQTLPPITMIGRARCRVRNVLNQATLAQMKDGGSGSSVGLDCSITS